jgi:hypothetical protein
LSDVGSRATKFTYTVDGGERVVVAVPPDTAKPLGVRLTGSVPVKNPGADAVRVTVPEDARPAKYTTLVGVVLPAG